jgi:hypothetical protein
MERRRDSVGPCENANKSELTFFKMRLALVIAGIGHWTISSPTKTAGQLLFHEIFVLEHISFDMRL